MKKIILFIALFAAIGCSQNLRITWAPNPVSERIELYKVFVFEGDSIEWQNWTIADMDSVGVVAHNPSATEYEFSYQFQEDAIIRGGLISVDSLTRVSKMGTTIFYFRPTENVTAEIKK